MKKTEVSLLSCHAGTRPIPVKFLYNADDVTCNHRRIIYVYANNLFFANIKIAGQIPPFFPDIFSGGPGTYYAFKNSGKIFLNIKPGICVKNNG